MNRAVLVIIVANVLFSLKGITDRSFLEKYKFQVGAILRGEQVRMLTSGFLHVDYLHLGLNMYALYIFANGVIHYLGVPYFYAVYLGSLLLGNFFSLFYHKKEAHYSAVGASGAVSGIIYSAIMLYPNMTLYLIPFPVPIPGYIFGIGYLLYSIYGMKNQLGNIGHSAHLGGAIGGFVLTLALFPQVLKEHPVMVGLLSIPIVILIVFGRRLMR